MTEPLSVEEVAALWERVAPDGSESRRPQQRAYLRDVWALLATLHAVRAEVEGLRAALEVVSAYSEANLSPAHRAFIERTIRAALRVPDIGERE